MLLHQNKQGLNPLMLALENGSDSSSDPVNLVKLMLDSPCGDNLILQRDKLMNTALHLAAKLSEIPLALSVVYTKTPQAQRVSKNDFGNTPLSEAILSESMDNALYLLQSSNDPKQIQEAVTIYKAYIENFTDKNVRLTDPRSCL
jgi:ankyrin repeat protein